MVPSFLRRPAFRLLKLLCREPSSALLRRVYRDWFGVEAGLWSYGCFDPGRFPPGTRIARYVSVARTATVFGADHPSQQVIQHPVAYNPAFGAVDRDLLDRTVLSIGEDVWLGHNVTVTAGCARIGRGAVVAAGAVVTSDVPPYAVVAGMPARILRMRFPEAVIAEIEATRWWELEPDGLRRLFADRPDFMRTPAVTDGGSPRSPD